MNDFKDLLKFFVEVADNTTNGVYKADLIDEGRNYFIYIDVPGVLKEDVKITYNGLYLNIDGHRTFPYIDCSISERIKGQFSRKFRIENIKKISSKIIEGVLIITLEKNEPVEIEIRVD